MTKKKTKTVAPENQASVGVLVPWGGSYNPKGYCDIHKHRYDGDVCPICDNTEE